jgi:predicted nucleic acid-binding protein
VILFADTSYWVALVRGKDPHRPAVVAWQGRILAEKIQLVTTEAVLWETLNSLAAVRSRAVAYRLYEQAHASSNITVVGFEPDLCHHAVELYVSRTDKDWGMIDCLSFVVMRLRSMDQALTADRHFEQAGFVALLRGEVSDGSS